MPDQLEEKAIKEITGTFVVPVYQRGYRWSGEQVRRLLDDIDAFRKSCTGPKAGAKYFLQPIVVKKMQDDDHWELIDGQQRLTSILLIHTYLSNMIFKDAPIPFALSYQSRPDSMGYLMDISEERSRENIDFYHIYQAYKTIKDWFEQHPDGAYVTAPGFLDTLSQKVYVLRYEIGADQNIEPAELFSRLNMGKIPLTNAELVKAWLMSSAAEGDQRVRETWNTEIGLQWDEIEHQLQRDEFWYFLTNLAPGNFPSRIELLFNIMSAKAPASQDPHHIFFSLTGAPPDGEEPRQEALWNLVRRYYQTLCYWYEDRDMYHQIGYLLCCGEKIELLLESYLKSSKKDFRAGLNQLIRKILSRSNVPSIDELDFKRHHKGITNLLLLFNVESVRCGGDGMFRYPFSSHKQKTWSLEHIQPQSAGELVKANDQRRWLEAHKSILEAWRTSPDEEDASRRTQTRDSLLADIGKLLEAINGKEKKSESTTGREKFYELSQKVIKFYNPADDEAALHGLGNLALLGFEENSALNNAVFAVKRRRLLELDKGGAFIPMATKHLFLRYYDSEQQAYNSPYWDIRDQENYLAAIKQSLAEYLPEGDLK